MRGRKLEQTKAAISVILGDLAPLDRFNLLAFSSQVEAWKPEAALADAAAVEDAQAWLQDLAAGGSNNFFLGSGGSCNKWNGLQ